MPYTDVVNRTVPVNLAAARGGIEHDRGHALEMGAGLGRETGRSEAADKQAHVGLAPFEQVVGREFARVIPRIAAGQVHAERIARLPRQHVVGPRHVAGTTEPTDVKPRSRVELRHELHQPFDRQMRSGRRASPKPKKTIPLRQPIIR